MDCAADFCIAMCIAAAKNGLVEIFAIMSNATPKPASARFQNFKPQICDAMKIMVFRETIEYEASEPQGNN